MLLQSTQLFKLSMVTPIRLINYHWKMLHFTSLRHIKTGSNRSFSTLHVIANPLTTGTKVFVCNPRRPRRSQAYHAYSAGFFLCVQASKVCKSICTSNTGWERYKTVCCIQGEHIFHSRAHGLQQLSLLTFEENKTFRSTPCFSG